MVNKSLFWIISFQRISWSSSQNKCEWLAYKSDPSRSFSKLTDSVIQLQQVGSFCHKKLTDLFFQKTLKHSTQVYDCFYDNFMILLWCFFEAWKPQLPFAVLHWKKNDQYSSEFSFCFSPKASHECLEQHEGVQMMTEFSFFWVNNAFKLSSDVLGNVSCSCKILSTAGFPTGLCLQVIESMWTISDFATVTQKAFRGDESNDILMHVPALLVCRVRWVLRMAKLEENW